MVFDMFSSYTDLEIGKKISLYPSYAAVNAYESSLEKETEIATNKNYKETEIPTYR